MGELSDHMEVSETAMELQNSVLEWRSSHRDSAQQSMASETNQTVCVRLRPCIKGEREMIGRTSRKRAEGDEEYEETLTTLFF